jgi:hypothetical protein
LGGDDNVDPATFQLDGGAQSCRAASEDQGFASVHW